MFWRIVDKKFEKFYYYPQFVGVVCLPLLGFLGTETEAVLVASPRLQHSTLLLSLTAPAMRGVCRFFLITVIAVVFIWTERPSHDFFFLVRKDFRAMLWFGAEVASFRSIWSL